jgi:predicted ATPase
VLIATKGWGAPEVERAYNRARELCQQIGETAQLFPVIWGLWAAHFSQGKVRTASEDAEQLLLLAQQGQNSDCLVLAHEAVGGALLYRGDLLAAQQHLDQALGCYNPQQPSDIVVSYGIDARVGCLGFCAWALSLLGYPAQARQKVSKVLTLTQEIAHPHSRAFALFFAVGFHQFHGETQVAQEHAETLVTLSRVQEFPYFWALGIIQQGQLLLRQGQREEGRARIQQGMDALKEVETELGQTGWLASLADNFGKAGQVEDGLAILAEAEAAMHRSGERLYEAELYRLKGELTLQQCKVQSAKCKMGHLPSEAEGYFHKAIEVARHQSAKLLELRATVSLSRLWQQQKKREEARKILTEMYGWFTEGFDTTDLQEANALLEELASE